MTEFEIVQFIDHHIKEYKLSSKRQKTSNLPQFAFLEPSCEVGYGPGYIFYQNS